MAFVRRTWALESPDEASLTDTMNTRPNMNMRRWSKGRASTTIHELLAASGLQPVDLPSALHTTSHDGLPTTTATFENTPNDGLSDYTFESNAPRPRLRPRVVSTIERRQATNKRSGMYYMEGSPGSRVSLNGPPPRQYEMDRQEDLLKLIAGIPALPAGDSEATPRQVVNPEKLGRLHEALESHPLRFDVAEEESPQDGDNDHRPDERRQTVSNLAPPALSPSASAQQAQLQVQAQAQAQAQAHASDTESAGISLSASLLSGSTTETREYCLVSGKQQDVQLLSSQGGGADADVPRWRAAATRRRHMHAKQGRELARLARAYVETRTSPLKALITGTPQSQTKTAAATTAAMG